MNIIDLGLVATRCSDKYDESGKGVFSAEGDRYFAGKKRVTEAGGSRFDASCRRRHKGWARNKGRGDSIYIVHINKNKI